MAVSQGRTSQEESITSTCSTIPLNPYFSLYCGLAVLFGKINKVTRRADKLFGLLWKLGLGPFIGTLQLFLCHQRNCCCGLDITSPWRTIIAAALKNLDHGCGPQQESCDLQKLRNTHYFLLGLLESKRILGIFDLLAFWLTVRLTKNP